MPKRNNTPPHNNNNNDPTGDKSVLQYAGLATQWLVSLGIGVFVGYKVDHWLHLKFPIAVWVLPLLILLGGLVRLIRETGGGK